jgi:hypothetical protein
VWDLLSRLTTDKSASMEHLETLDMEIGDHMSGKVSTVYDIADVLNYLVIADVSNSMT